ncbi:MAG: PAS domain S-box protein, partial [Thermoanaerobaculia bacterium]
MAAKARPRRGFVANEDAFARVFEASPVAISLSSLVDGRILEVNESFLRLFGFTRRAVIGRTAAKLGIAPAELRRDVLARLEKGERVDGLEWDFRTRSGEKRHGVVSLERVEIGRHPCLLAFSLDVTDRRRLERALVEKTEFLDRLLETAPVPIYAVDSEGRILMVNKAWQETTSVARGDALGRMPRDLFPSTITRVTEDVASRVFAGESIVSEDVFETPAGRRYFLTARFPLRGGSDRVEAMGGIGIETTERRRMADELVASEERYRFLFERNPLPMWVYDRETLHFLAVNEASVRHYGYSREEFRSMTVVDIRPEEEQPRLREEVRDIEGYRFSGRWKLRKKDGSVVNVEILSHDIPFAERPARVVLANDVTDRLAAEEGLRRSYDELRALSARLESVREEESTRIAREVHDEVGQALTALKMDVAEVERGLAAAGGAPEAVRGTLSDMGGLLDETMDVVHRISTELRPGVLDELGLEEAVEWQLEEFRKRTGIACRFEASF